MAVRDVLLSGDPRLRQPSRAVPPSQFGGEVLLALVQDLRDTMAARDGAGLAAPQIGVPLRVVIFGISRNPLYPQAPRLRKRSPIPWGAQRREPRRRSTKTGTARLSLQ
jgi:peptide deformylase